VPQVPQLFGSTARLVQVLVLWQYVVPAGHWHLPALQATPLGQAVPHCPQFLPSLDVSVHFALQDVCPLGHWHFPPTHAMPAGQALLH
jgi:hypothetical protein